MTKILHGVVDEGYLCLGLCRVSKDKIAKTEKEITCKNCLRILAKLKLEKKYMFGETWINSSLAPVVTGGV